MTKKTKTVVLAGAAVVLTGIIAVSLFTGRKEAPSRQGAEQATEAVKKERKDEGPPEKRTQEKKEDAGEERIRVRDIGHLYYLAPEGDQAFEESLTRYLEEKKIRGKEARVLEYHIDDRAREDEPAEFFIRIEGAGVKIIRVSFEKTTGRYGFSLEEEGLPEAADPGESEGLTEFAIPESTEDEAIPSLPVTIKDPEGELAAAADIPELKKALAQYLRSIGEGRRAFLVSSAGTTERGYEAVLMFETVRHDGRNIEVRYDGAFHFRLV